MRGKFVASNDVHHHVLRRITSEMRVIARPSANNGRAAHTSVACREREAFPMSFTTVTTLRSSIAHRRAARTDRRRLAQELASYQTPAERLELGLILGRSSAEDTAEVDAILSRQATLASSRLGR